MDHVVMRVARDIVIQRIEGFHLLSVFLVILLGLWCQLHLGVVVPNEILLFLLLLVDHRVDRWLFWHVLELAVLQRGPIGDRSLDVVSRNLVEERVELLPALLLLRR